MRFQHYLGLVFGGGFVAAMMACGGSSTTTTGAGASTSASATHSASHSSSSETSTTSTGGTGGMSGNHDFANAADIMVDDQNPTMGSLTDPSNTSDFYKFTGKKGDKIGIFTQAKTLIMGGDPFDQTVVDVVATLYDMSQTQIAQDDDPWPRDSNDPILFTVLPADGDYYIEIAECNKAFPMGCADPAMLMTFDYTLQVLHLGGKADTNEGMEPNDTPMQSMANLAFIASGNMAKYGVGLADGAFSSATDTDVFNITIPMDVLQSPNARPHLEMWLQTPGPMNGNGSTSPMKAWLVDPADMMANGKPIASVDQANYGDGDNFTNPPANLSAPVVPGNSYQLFIQHGAGAAGSNDFYFLQHFPGTYYYGQVEKADATNGVYTTAETLTGNKNADGSVTYAIDGNLTPAGMDIDVFEMDVPAGLKNAGGLCEAARIGSGIQGLKFTLLDDKGAPIPTGSFTETKNAAASFPKLVPLSTTKIYGQVEGASQDANIAGTHYRCFVFVQM